jgi:F-type H+-transporting ATPase subunit a
VIALILIALLVSPFFAGGGHGESTVNAIHHVQDGQAIALPFLGTVQLPTLHLGPLDLPITRHTLMLWTAALLLVVLFGLARKGGGLVPRGLYNAFESVVVYIRDEIAVKTIGEPWATRFTPWLLTVFFFVLTCNLLGLVPYGHTATGNINVTATLAATSFIAFVGAGMIQFGPFGFFRNLVPHGVPVFLAPVMLVVELMGMLAKPFALAVRLFANMLAGHMVILSLLGLIFSFNVLFGAGGGIGVAPVSVAFSLFVYLLELLVALIQAYIFTFLTALFIGMSVHAH